MAKSKSNNRIANKTIKEANKTPETQADFYAAAWTIEFNKLGKPEQEALTANLKAAPYIVRGQPMNYSNVNSFVKSVVCTGEENYAKYLESKARKQARDERNAAK